ACAIRELGFTGRTPVHPGWGVTVITHRKVLERINARVAQDNINPDDVNEVVNDLMDDDGGNVNGLRGAYPSSMTPQMFAYYHREIMEGISSLQTLGHAHTAQLRGVATTQKLHERRIIGLESDMSSLRGFVDRIERHLLRLPPQPVPPPAHPSRPRPTIPYGPNYDSDNVSDSV
ncbi:hypothetical protein Dimus_030842, partial [Dionaea muscipula]